ncbi:hypothetical protein [Escherichia coli]|uniref:hypothetical protein n=1 Tax=Escherichia coli TaxID=562 RepID=UPI0033065563
MLRKLGSYPRQNGLAVALRELGRTSARRSSRLAAKCWNWRCRAHAGLNKR